MEKIISNYSRSWINVSFSFFFNILLLLFQISSFSSFKYILFIIRSFYTIFFFFRANDKFDLFVIGLDEDIIRYNFFRLKKKNVTFNRLCSRRIVLWTCSLRGTYPTLPSRCTNSLRVSWSMWPMFFVNKVVTSLTKL